LVALEDARLRGRREAGVFLVAWTIENTRSLQRGNPRSLQRQGSHAARPSPGDAHTASCCVGQETMSPCPRNPERRRSSRHPRGKATLWRSVLGRTRTLGLPQHADEHRPERPVLLAVDQEFPRGAGLRVAPELADALGAVEIVWLHRGRRWPVSVRSRSWPVSVRSRSWPVSVKDPGLGTESCQLKDPSYARDAFISTTGWPLPASALIKQWMALVSRKVS
jgi:hypothetical protein